MQAAINERCLTLGKKKSRAVCDDEEGQPRKRARKGEGGGGCPYNRAGAGELLREEALLNESDGVLRLGEGGPDGDSLR